MQSESFDIDGPLLLSLDRFDDGRGSFCEWFSTKYASHGIPTIFAQDNLSCSKARVLRGIHFQQGQGKLVSVIQGEIFDIAVDLRPDSPSFGKYTSVRLSSNTPQLFWIPPGFGHGFCVLGEEEAKVLYKVTTLYDPALESGIAWNDPEINVDWPVKEPIVSDRDADLPKLSGSGLILPP